MKTLTREEILALSPADIDAARQRAREARATRAGVSTVDFILNQIDGKSRTLETAKAYLLQMCDKAES